jgi:transposase
MPKPFSVDLRERVLADYDLGARPVDLAVKYRVCERWVFKLVKQRQETGSIEPLRGKTGPKPKLGEHLEQLRALVNQRPDATLEELRQQLPVRVCVVTVWNALQRMEITLKKSPASRGAKAS